MKKLLTTLLAVGLCWSAAADEGMWLLPYLQKMNAKELKKAGCKLSPKAIYNAEGSSLKDAVIIFGGGCTGEIVSPEGLILTNYHCGFGSIQQLSSVTHDYIKDGFWAMSQAEELPVPGLSVQFIRKIQEVTAEVLGNVPSIAGAAEFERITKENLLALQVELAQANPGMEVEIKPFFEGNQYFAFIKERYTDIRLVGTPPRAVGKFGGDTDNWMWPRHQCDFSVFRVYANKENRPADYSAENRPYQTDNYLTISTQGYNEGDFTMIMGFPGSTTRYATSYELENLVNRQIPQRVYIRGERQDLMRAAMLADPQVMIQYAAKYASSSNYWKNSIGMARGIKRLKVIDRKRAQEEAFQQWADAKTLPEEGYMTALQTIASTYEQMPVVSENLMIAQEALQRSIEITSVAGKFATLNGVITNRKGDDTRAAVTASFEKDLTSWFKDYNAELDRKITKRMLEIARERMAFDYLPDIFFVIHQDFGDDISAYVDDLFARTQFASEASAQALLKDFSTERYNADPVTKLYGSLKRCYGNLVKARNRLLSEEYRQARRKYVAGLMLREPGRAWASDANFTIRMTYGHILPYEPADGVRYNHFTTLKGVMEKENPAIPMDFTVTDRMKELFAAGDFGRYANAAGELPTCFLNSCDITGGNSGSPTLNANGELIGLAFDGNWEAMSGDVAFEPELQRTISVDIRFVLFIIERYGNAGWLLNEMRIK